MKQCVKYWCVFTVVENYVQLLINENINKITPHIKVQVELQKIEIRIFTGSDGGNFQNTFIIPPLY